LPRPTANRAPLQDGAKIASKKLRSRIQKCLCGIKKLLAYEKEVNEGLQAPALVAMPKVKDSVQTSLFG
jgi:hypothetical protein